MEAWKDEEYIKKIRNIWCDICYGVWDVNALFYDWSGKNPVVALFAPYNESTWEHLKLLFFPVLIYSVFQYAYIGKQYSGYLTGRLAGIVSGALMIVIIFYTYMAVFKHSILWIDVTLFYLSVIVCYRIAYSITLQEIPRAAEILSGICLIGIMLLFFCISGSWVNF